jgi:hypothetical protein
VRNDVSSAVVLGTLAGLSFGAGIVGVILGQPANFGEVVVGVLVVAVCVAITPPVWLLCFLVGVAVLKVQARRERRWLKEERNMQRLQEAADRASELAARVEAHSQPGGNEVSAERWLAIVLTAPDDPEGHWVALPENGRGALVAYLAGPGRARPQGWAPRTVEVTEDRAGTRRVRHEPMTPGDVASIQNTIAVELADLGICAPPNTWWEVDLPKWMSYDHLARQLNAAIGGLQPDTGSGAERARRRTDAVRHELRGILGEPDLHPPVFARAARRAPWDDPTI